MFPHARTRGGPTSRLWFLSLVLVSCFLLFASSAQGQVDPCYSEVYALCNNAVLVLPDGAGDPLGDIGLVVVCRDQFGIPISGIPASAFDIQAWDQGSQTFLRGSSTSLGTGSTDQEGRILLTEAFSGAGFIVASELLVTVDEGGGPVALDCNSMPTVDFRSPDFNADFQVNLLDVAVFAGCYQPNYCPEADFDNNGVVGLSDLVIFQKYLLLSPKMADAATISSRQEPERLANGQEGLFNGCLQRDFDDDGLASTLRDSIFAVAGVPFDLSIVATEFSSLAGVKFDLLLPSTVFLSGVPCFTAEPPLALALGQTVPCGTNVLPSLSFTIGASACLYSGPIFVCHFQFVSTLTGPLKVDEFLLTGTLSDCAKHPHETVACIGSPTPCEVSEIDIGTPLFVSCPAGDLDVDDTITVILRDRDSSPVSGIPASTIEVSAVDKLTGLNEGRFRFTPLLNQTDANGALPYRFEPKEVCRWDWCVDLLITAKVENCELTASKRVRTVNVVRWEDDPLMTLDDEINDSDLQAVSDAMFTAEPCFDFLETYRCPVVTQAALDLVNTHYGHSCSITASPAVLPSPRMMLGQNVPNPFNPSTVLTVSLTHSSPSARLTVYTLDGRLVRTLWSGPLDAGETQFTWDGTDAQARPVASGIYLAQLSSGASHSSVRMVLLR